MYVVNLGNFELGDILSTLGNIMKVTLTPEEDNSPKLNISEIRRLLMKKLFWKMLSSTQVR